MGFPTPKIIVNVFQAITVAEWARKMALDKRNVIRRCHQLYPRVEHITLEQAQLLKPKFRVRKKRKRKKRKYYGDILAPSLQEMVEKVKNEHIHSAKYIYAEKRKLARRRPGLSLLACSGFDVGSWFSAESLAKTRKALQPRPAPSGRRSSKGQKKPRVLRQGDD